MALVRYLCQWSLMEATSDGSGTLPKTHGDKLSPESQITSFIMFNEDTEVLLIYDYIDYIEVILGVWSSKAASIFSSNTLYVPAYGMI